MDEKNGERPGCSLFSLCFPRAISIRVLACASCSFCALYEKREREREERDREGRDGGMREERKV